MLSYKKIKTDKDQIFDKSSQSTGLNVKRVA